MEGMVQDLRFGLRSLLRSPGFAIVAVGTLALGIGANTAIFSVVNAALLRPLPWKNSDSLVRFYETNTKRGWDSFSVSGPNFLDWRRQNELFESLAAWRTMSFNLIGSTGAEQVNGGAATAGLLPLLNVEPALGRNFLPDEDRPGGNELVVLLSHALWRDRFGSDPGILGRTLQLDGRPFTVVGVLPEDFQWVTGSDVIVPLEPRLDDRRGNHVLAVFGRLKEGVTLDRARAEMEVISTRLSQQYPDLMSEWGVRVISFYDWILDPDFRRALWMLAAAVGFVLLIACANVASLFLARTSARHREFAIRTSLGAGRLRLARQLLTECVLISAMGGVPGLLLGFWGVDLIRGLSPGNLPRLDEAGIDARVLIFATGVSLLTGLLFGLAPALQTTASGLGEALKEGHHGGGASRQRLRATLVVAELAASLVLLIGAGLLIRSYRQLSGVDPGFSPDNLVTMQLNLPAARYATPAQSAALVSRLLERLGALPGVEHAAAGNIAPFGAGNTAIGVEVEGRPPDSGESPSANWRMVTPDYFRTLGVPLIAGRVFTEGDADGAPRALVISETMARRFWPGQDPVGRRLRTAPAGPWTTIVGVVGDVRNTGLDQEIRPTIYLPAYQSNWTPMSLLVRTTSDPAAVAASIRAEVKSLDPDLPISNVATMNDLIAGSVAPMRFNMLLLTIFALVALALAGVGIYGVTAYSVTQRTREIGIRVALGARQRDILSMVVRQGLKLAIAGIATGLAASLALTHLLSSLLFGIGAADPATFAGVAVLLALVTLLACYIPARRASRVEPTIALRCE